MAETASAGLRRFRMILWVLVGIAAIGATVLYFVRPPQAPLAVTGRPFEVATLSGQPFTEASLKGKPSLVFFGYTHCPDVCPTTLAETEVWKTELGLDADDLRVIFVTVDPKRDTPEVLTDYLGYYPGVIGLVGDEAQTEAIKAAFGAAAEFTEPDASGFYLVNHTASVFLINADGSFEGLIDYKENKATAEGKIEKLLRG